MIVKNIWKLTQGMGRFHRMVVSKPVEYYHTAPPQRSSFRQRTECSGSLSVYVDHPVARITPQASHSSGNMFWAFTAAFTLNLFGGTDEKEETPEDKLVKTIKRSILCIQREQYDRAEQMLHLALRMAQDIQSKEGITYVYDVMANLAMEREQFKKAEKIFADVMKRLLADGHSEESPKVR